MAVNQTSQSTLQPLDGGPQHYKSGFPQSTTFDYDPGVLMLPVAGETSKVVKVRIHGGYSTRRVAFNVVRENNPPIIPKPEDITNASTGRNEVLVGCNLDIPLPSESPTKVGLTWQVRGEYVFVETGDETTTTETGNPSPPPEDQTTTSTDPSTGVVTTVVVKADGSTVTTRQVPAARVPGRDLLPLGGYPYSLGPVDQLAGVVSKAAGNLQALSELMKPLVASDKHLWPITVLPPFIFNGNLLKE